MTMLPMAMLAAALLALVAAVASEARAGKRQKLRLERARRGLPGESAGRDPALPASVRRQPAKALLGRFGQDMARLLPRAEALRERLDRAGIALNVLDYALLCLAAGLGMGVLVQLLYVPGWLLSAGIGIIAATGVPHALVGRRIARRQHQFLSQFPDAIDLIVRSVKSGLPVTEALQTVAQELPNQVGRLFQEVTGTIKLGKSLDESLDIVARRTRIQEFKFFVISLAIQQETGGNLAEILQNLGGLMRRREQVKLKIRAMSSEARASAMIIGSLPFIMFGLIYVVDAVYIMKLFVDPRGWVLLTAGLVSLGLGLGIMAKMIRFEI
jgi:tight adherence protein B